MVWEIVCIFVYGHFCHWKDVERFFQQRIMLWILLFFARGALSNDATKRFYSVDQIALLSSFQFSLDVCAYLVFVKFVIADREYNSVL